MDINQEFWNVIRFLPPDGYKNRSFYQPEYKIDELHGKQGDFYRVLLPKGDLQGSDIERVSVVLINPDLITVAGDELKFANPPIIGKARKQNCEYYSEFELLVNSVPNGTTYKQFAINRSNGKNVFGTFKSQQTTMDGYMKELREHFEKNGFTGALCEVNGNLLTVRAYNNGAFYLSDEKCSIGIGTVSETNDNSPQIEFRKLNTISVGAKYRFDLDIQNITIGNILRLAGRTVTVDSSTTVESAKAYLLNGKEYYEILQTQNVEYSSELGTYQTFNDIKPTVTALYSQTNGGKDWYKVSITGEITEGNILQVSGVGRTPITKTVTETDTLISLNTLFNPDAGFFQVNQGTGEPVINVYEGKKEVPNSNSLRYGLINKQSIPSRNVDRYQCYITDDVMLRNEFYLMDKTYIAKTGDTALDVALALGQDKRQFVYEVTAGTQFKAYAQKGKKYGAENVADVIIAKQPKVKKPTQCVLEFTIPSATNVESTLGKFQLALYDTLYEKIIALGNYVNFNNLPSDSIMVEFADTEETYGFEYYERGLSQIMRLPIHLKHFKTETEENMTNRINGGFSREETNIMQYREFVTEVIEDNTAFALQALFRHQHIGINGERYQQKGELSEGYYDDFIGKAQLTGKLYRQGKKSNSGSFGMNSNLQGYGMVSVTGDSYGMRILARADGVERLVDDFSRLPCKDYEFIIDNPQQSKVCTIYQDDLEINKVVLMQNSRAKFKSLIRLNVDSSIKFKIEPLIGTYAITATTNQLAYSQEPTVTTYDNEVIETMSFDYFDHDDFDRDYL
jgi:hypothetical protein